MRKYQRPPLSVLKESTASLPETIRTKLQNVYTTKVKTDQEMSLWEYTRGSQAVFRCAFQSCNKFTDADLQAALWISLKGYLHNIYNTFRTEEKDISDKKALKWKKAMYEKILSKKEITEVLNICNQSGKDYITSLLQFAQRHRMRL